MLTCLRHNQRNWTSEVQAATGRSAISRLIDVLKPTKVMLPTYVPEGVIIPFQYMGVPITYYKLRTDLRPDLDHVQKNLSKGVLFVLIHYFGYLTENGALRDIIHEAEGIVFEDCAHALFAKAKEADVALWVYNKFLPVVDGAILRSRRRSIDLTTRPTMELPSGVLNSYHQHLDLNTCILRARDPKLVRDLENESRLAYEKYYSFINNDLTVYSQSVESKCIISSTDLKEVEHIRSHNAQNYYKQTPECFVFRPKTPIAPFAYPIVVRHPHNCEDVYLALLDAGILPSRLIEKWDHIPKGDDRFELEHTFMDQHLLLPVDEDVTYNDIKRVGTVLRRFADG